jgi:hypothetical protein
LSHQPKMILKMALLSNRIVIIGLLLFFIIPYASAQDKRRKKYEDYKDPEQFDKFYKRRNIIGAWQINALKEGALVVRLKTNKLVIDGLRNQGNDQRAEQIMHEQFAINKNTMFAYLDHFKFCKVYFIYSNSSDSLLNGARSGIFLDTSLSINPGIVMDEKFYLIAERDYAYNSSIGFVPEDSAAYILEGGNPVKEMAIIVKNKYGHQLKSPFPYYVMENTYMDAAYFFPFEIVALSGGGAAVNYNVNKTFLQDIKENDNRAAVYKKPNGNGGKTVEVKKHFTYERLGIAVQQLDDKLTGFYRASPKPDVQKIEPSVRPFLY